MNLNKISVGNRIRLVRKELGLSMKGFEEEIAPIVADSIVSRQERRISLPNNNRLTQIAKIAHKDINWLLQGTFKEFISSLLDKEGYTNFLNDSPETVNTIYNGLTPIPENLQLPDYENSILRLFNKVYSPMSNDYCLDIIELDLKDLINKRHSISFDKFKDRFLSSFHEGAPNSGYKYGDMDLIYKYEIVLFEKLNDSYKLDNLCESMNVYSSAITVSTEDTEKLIYTICKSLDIPPQKGSNTVQILSKDHNNS